MTARRKTALLLLVVIFLTSLPFQVQAQIVPPIGPFAAMRGFLGIANLLLPEHPIDSMINLIQAGERFIFNNLAEGTVSLITIGKFTSTDFVTTLWPITLALANLGFLLALITIALLVTLHLDAGGGVRRLLPRLLLGALLVNFSLVIGGAIIDLSRLVMAFIADFYQMADVPSTVFVDLWKNISPLSEAFANLGSWSSTALGFVEVVLYLILLIALIIVTVLLLVRYLVLVLLLAISPLAYLALAFPGMQKLSAKWWSAFLRYVLYGPAVLLLLVLTMKASKLLPMGLNITADAKTVLRVFISSAGLIFAAIVGYQASIIGSGMTLNLVGRGGRRVRGMLYRGGRGAAKGAAKGAYVLSGSRRLVRETRGGLRQAAQPIRRALRTGEFSRFDKQGQLKEGKRAAFGHGTARTLERLGIGRGKDYQTVRQARQTLKADRGITPSNVTNNAFSALNLRNKKVGQELLRGPGGNENFARIAGYGNANQIRGLVKNKVMSQLNDQEKINLVANININPQVVAMTTQKRADFMEKILDSLGKVQTAAAGGKDSQTT